MASDVSDTTSAGGAYDDDSYSFQGIAKCLVIYAHRSSLSYTIVTPIVAYPCHIHAYIVHTDDGFLVDRVVNKRAIIISYRYMLYNGCALWYDMIIGMVWARGRQHAHLRYCFRHAINVPSSLCLSVCWCQCPLLIDMHGIWYGMVWININRCIWHSDQPWYLYSSGTTTTHILLVAGHILLASSTLYE